MKANCYGLTDVGTTRKGNDDFYLLDEDLSLFIVCDGVGGNLAGDYASQLCAKTVLDVVRKHRSIVDRYNADPTRANRDEAAQLIQNAIQTANVKVVEEAALDEKRHGMATTCEVILLAGDHAILGHVGDSRTYLLRDGGIHQLTSDHKVADEMIKQGLWTKDDAKKNNFSNVLTRAIGASQFVQADTLLVELIEGDLFLLCSDGLHGYFKKNEFAELAKKSELNRLPSELIKFANQSGGKDNITAVVVKMEGVAQAPEAFNALRKSETLGKVPLFRYLSYAELMQVLNLVTVQNFPAEYEMFEEGAPSETLFVVIEGNVQVLKGKQQIATRGPGDAFGDMGIFDRAPRSATVRTLVNTVTMSIDRRELIALLKKDAPIAVKLLWALNQELSMSLRKTSSELAQVKAGVVAEPPFVQTLRD